jgi:hypothetical protein
LLGSEDELLYRLFGCLLGMGGGGEVIGDRAYSCTECQRDRARGGGGSPSRAACALAGGGGGVVNAAARRYF